MVRVADYVMQFLADKGIGTVFTITGRGILYLTDALAREERLTPLSMHHEQAVSYAGYGYTQMNDGNGACLVSTGCASTNALTGVLCAWQDDVPCLIISGQNPLKETSAHTGIPVRTYGSQEANILPIVQSVTKYAVMLEKAEDIAYELEKAYDLAHSDRKGPVWIDIPLDIQNARIDPEQLKHYDSASIDHNTDSSIGLKVENIVSDILGFLNQSERPVVLVGGGVREAGAIEELFLFIENYGLPVVFSPSAVDTYGVGEKNGIGAVGSLGGTRAGNFTMQNADLLLVLGHRMTSMTTGDQPEKFARDARVVVVNTDEDEKRACPVQVDRWFPYDLKEVLEALIVATSERSHDNWLNKCLHWKEVFPRCEDKYGSSDRVDLFYLAECLGKEMGDGDIVLTDAGFEELIIPAGVAFRRGQRCIHPVSQGAMGFALPAAVGVVQATCDRSMDESVWVVTGDGSVMMNLQELQTIAYHGLPIKIIITNNNCYAVIRKRQNDLFRSRTIGTDAENGVSCPDYRKVADAFGITYMHIDGSDELEEGLNNLSNCKDPVICEIKCVEEQDYLHTSFGKSRQGKMVRRPLEDLSPFLNRELIETEMVIEPIDL